jgi:hypothetical protein
VLHAPGVTVQNIVSTQDASKTPSKPVSGPLEGAEGVEAQGTS